MEPTVSSGWVAAPRAGRRERVPGLLQLLGLASWAVMLPAFQKHNILWVLTLGNLDTAKIIIIEKM